MDSTAEFDDGMPRGKREEAKARTRRRLLAAARDLQKEGAPVTVAVAARRAGISIATAYRYYSDPEKLCSDAMLELALDAGRDDLLERFETLADGVEDPLERAVIAQRQLLELAESDDVAYRLYIAKKQEQRVREAAKGAPVPEGGRREMLLEAALSGLKPELPESSWRGLVLALMLVTGPEPYFTLFDRGGLKGEPLYRTAEAALRDIYTAQMARLRSA